MNMPGFTAEASLYPGVGYALSAGLFGPGGAIVPQLYCDPVCQDNCPDPADCSDLPTPQARAACVRAALACRRGCCCPSPPTCGPCTPTGTCNTNCTPIRNQTCTDCHGR